MDTSLARRQRLRRNGTPRRGGPGTVSRVAIAIPLFLFGTFLLMGLVGFVVAVSAYSAYSQDLGDPETLLNAITFDQQTVVYDSTGKVELARFGQQKRLLVKFSDIPRTLIDATTSIEDRTFWDNAGFDPLAIVSAAYDSIRGRSRGASTITQQLVRARLLPDSVLQGSSVDRKIKEIIQSIRLTEAFPGDEGKRRIMEYYLNQNFYGNQSYGVAAAAKSYFGVTDLRKLTLAQAAILAAIPQSPSDYDLVKNADQQTDATGKPILVVPPDAPIVIRRNLVLERMKANRVLTQAGLDGGITDAQLEAAKKDPVILAPQVLANWRAPHFVWQVRNQLAAILCPQDPTACDKVDTGGYRVTTTLDWKMQQTAEKWVQAAVLGPNANDTAAYLKGRGITNADWITNLREKNIHNGALVAIDYRTGQILAYVGSASYYSPVKSKQFQPQFDVLADGWRQPGSAMKPINYVVGFEDRTLTPATMFMDVTTNFTPGAPPDGYIPTDADGQERGPLRLREALQFSLNIPAVKAAIINTPDHVLDVSRRFGLQFPQGVDPGSSVALGTLEVHPKDMVAAYGAIANGGVLMPQTTISSIVDAKGVQIYPAKAAKPRGTAVVSPQAAYLITDILAGNTVPSINPYWGKFEITTSKGAHVNAALKTGTTNDTKDLSAYGFLAPPDDPNAPAIAVGVWMGNSDNSKTKGVFSLDSTAPLYKSFLTEVVKTHPVGSFKEPPGIVHATVDAWTGLLPGPFATQTVDEIFIDGTAPTKRDDTKVGIDVDSASGLLWAAGCAGPMETKGFLDLSGVDAGFPAWQQADQGWIKRAMKGPGTRGGPAKDTKTATAYFYQGGFQPYGSSWGAPFPPTDTCTPGASPAPSGDTVNCPPGGVQLNPDGTLALDANGQPIPCPAEPSPTICPAGEVQLNPDGTPVLDQNGQPVPCPVGTAPPPEPTPAPTPEPTRPPQPTPEPTVPQASV